MTKFELEEWAEVHFEITSEINIILDGDDRTVSPVWKIRSDHGCGGIWQLAFALTNKFQEQYKGIVWGEELEWMDTLEKFYEEELYKQL